MVICEKIRVGDFATNCYIFGDKSTKEVNIIDPGGEPNKIIDFIKKNEYIVRNIILTHGHFDHIGGLKVLKQQFEVPVLIHKLDGEMLTDPAQNFSKFIGLKNGEIIQDTADKFVEDGETLKIGDIPYKIIHTPGHTRGGISILFDKYLFSGDTLFKESVGRTDLPFSNHSDILESARKLLELSDDLVVYPGHGECTSIGYERANNPFINE